MIFATPELAPVRQNILKLRRDLKVHMSEGARAKLFFDLNALIRLLPEQEQAELLEEMSGE